MSASFDLDPVARITASALGEPGHRTFYIQARRDDLLVSLLVEKAQVEELARYIEALLARLQETHPTAAEPAEVGLELEEPVIPEFRVGRMALGYDGERDLVLLQCEEFVPPDDDEEEEGDEGSEGEDPLAEELQALIEREEPEGSLARFWATREQMRALARHAASVVASGRPRCKLCGGPIDPDGHFCPARNGHRELHDLS